MNRKIEFIYPVKTQAISLTGGICGLSCKHCGGIYLNFMKTKKDIDCLKDKTSFLISGGSDKFGSVPIKENLNFLKDLKSKGYKLNLHTGLPDKDIIDDLKSIADTVSFDFIVDDETIKTVYGLSVAGQYYYDILEFMLKKGLKVIPHVTIGILGGKIKGEYDAIRLLKDLPCEEIILLIFIPTKGTFYENCAAVPISEVEKLFYYTRKILRDKKITLGCLRPKGSYRYLTDITAINNYFDKIVMPHFKAVEYAKERHMDIIKKEECCALD